MQVTDGHLVAGSTADLEVGQGVRLRGAADVGQRDGLRRPARRRLLIVRAVRRDVDEPVRLDRAGVGGQVRTPLGLPISGEVEHVVGVARQVRGEQTIVDLVRAARPQHRRPGDEQRHHRPRGGQPHPPPTHQQAGHQRERHPGQGRQRRRWVQHLDDRQRETEQCRAAAEHQHGPQPAAAAGLTQRRGVRGRAREQPEQPGRHHDRTDQEQRDQRARSLPERGGHDQDGRPVRNGRPDQPDEQQLCHTRISHGRKRRRPTRTARRAPRPAARSTRPRAPR